MRRNPIDDYRRLVGRYYGARPSTAQRADRRPIAIARSFDDGRPVAVAPSAGQTEYDIAVGNPDYRPVERASPARTSPPPAISPPEGATAPAPEVPGPSSAPQPQLEPPSKAASPPTASAQEFTKRQLEHIIKDSELFADIQSILGGNKEPPAKPAKAAAGSANAPTRAEAAASPPAEPPDNEHAIFEKIAQNMRYATAYDLGSVALEQRFDDFDRFERSARSARAPAKARALEIDRSSPPRPVDLRRYTATEREQAFGRFEYEPAPERMNGDGIRILGSWEADNIVDVPIPQLDGKRFMGRAMERGMIRFHRLGQQALIDLWKDWESAGLLDRVLTFNGGFTPRFIRGTQDRDPRPLSNHAWGTAFDINAQWNPFKHAPAPIGQEGCVRELVELANRHGFYWGGHFPTSTDGMHFELGKRIT